MTREQIFAAKARNYPVCYSATCPLREHCLHSILASYTPADQIFVHTVNLNNPQVQKSDCPEFRKDEPIRMPAGLSTIYYDMPSRIERAIKHHPMTPDVEHYVRQVIKNAGWTEEPRFLTYVEEYLW